MNQTIEIVISPQGGTTVTTRGFLGPSCREASRFLEEALGTATKEILTSEFHQSTEIETAQEEPEHPSA